MRKSMLRNAILLALSLCLLTACNQPAPVVKPKIGIIDTARVFRESEPAKAGVKFLEGIHAEMQGQLTALQEKMQADPENLELQQQVQTMYNEFQQRIGAEEQNVVNLLQDTMQRNIDAMRNSKQLDLIVGAEVALSYSEALNLTTEIIAEMNKQNIEFKAIAPETPADAMDAAPMQAPVTMQDPASEKATPEAAPAAPAAEETPAADQAPKADPKEDAKETPAKQ